MTYEMNLILLRIGENIVTAYGLFELSGETQGLCIRAISVGFVFAGVNIAFQGVFQVQDGVEWLVWSVFHKRGVLDFSGGCGDF